MVVRLTFIVFFLFCSVTNLLASVDDSTSALLDSMKVAYANDFKEIEKQLVLNEKNIRDGVEGKNKYVFHSSVSMNSSASGTYVYWKREMQKPEVKASYNAGTSNEMEMNRILDDLYKVHGRKLVVYMTSIMTYPGEKDGYSNKDGKMEETHFIRRSYLCKKKLYYLNDLLTGAEKNISDEMYGSIDAPRNFTVVSVIRFLEFNIERKESTTRINYEFQTLDNLQENFSLKHVIRLLPAKYMNEQCKDRMKSTFNSQVNSNLLTFVQKIAVQYNDGVCDPAISCDVTAAPLISAITKGDTDGMLDAANQILYRTPGQKPGTFGDQSLNYDMYVKTLMHCMSFEQRIKALKLVLNTNWVGGSKERFLVSLVEHIPNNERNELLNRLKNDKINNVCLLTALYRSVHGDEFDLLINALWQNIKYCKRNTRAVVDAYSDTKWQLFGRGYFATQVYLEESISDDGKISLRSKSTYLRDNYEPGQNFELPTPNLDPYEFIMVSFQSNYQFGAKQYRKGDCVFVPACIVYGMFNAENNQRLLQTSLLAIDVGLMYIGVGEIRAAIRAGEFGFQFAVALIDLHVGLGSLFIDHVLATRLEQTDEGRKFLEAYAYFQIAYGAVAFGAPMLDNALKMQKAANKINTDGKLISANGDEYTLTPAEKASLLNSANNAVDYCQSAKSGNFPETTLQKLRNKEYSSIPDAEKQVLIDNHIPQEHWDDAACMTSANCNLLCAYPGIKCFTAGTLVQTESGSSPIEQIKVNDKVKTFNHKSGKSVLNRVASFKKSVTAILTAVLLSTGDTIWTTPEHPFYSNGKYIEASKLETGNELFTLDNRKEKVVVTKIFQKDTTATVYNFTVEENQNYYVGRIPILVHNDCFLEKLKKDFPVLNDKVDALNARQKKAFLDDFREAPNTVLTSLSTTNGFDLWKNVQSFPAGQRTSFVDDFTKKKAFRDAIVNDPSLIEPWKFMCDAGMSKPERFRTNIDALQKVQDLRSNQNLTTMLPSVLKDKKQKYATVDDLMKAYLKNYSLAANASGGVLTLENELSNFQKFFSSDPALMLHQKTGANSFLEEMFQSASKFKGCSFQLDLIYRQPRPKLLQDKNVSGFEYHIDQNTSGNRMDILFEINGSDNLLKVECKNYQSVTYYDWRNNVTKETLQSITFKNQFMAYLKSSDSWDDFAYFFKDRSGISLEEIKLEFQKIYREKADEIFESGTFTEEQLINLFNTNEKQRFLQIVADGSPTTSPIYQFIHFE